MNRCRPLSFAALLAACIAAPSFAAPVPPPDPPKLVVLLVVDQMRADYVEQYGPTWTGGLRRLVDNGAWFRRAAYPYGATVTCVGHSTIATGSLPSTHGVVNNSWYDRATGEVVGCAADPATSLVRYGQGPAATGSSTHRLMVPTLADEMRFQLPHAPRIVTFSLKSYTAAMMAGRTADAATWFDGDTGQWTTSTAFSPVPVPWLSALIGRQKLEAIAGETWRKLLPPGAYWHEDDGKGERGAPQWTANFPHQMAGRKEKAGGEFFEAWQSSPFSDSHLAQLAIAAIDEMKLGQCDGTDYLAISFSALDIVGHDFGPRSHEVQDLLARLDGTLAVLLDHLDRHVPGRYVLALTGDHGVAPIPEQVTASGMSAGRLPAARLAGLVEKALEPTLGPGKHVARLVGNDLTFAPGVWEKLRANPVALAGMMDAIRQAPGVAAAFHRDQLKAMAAAPGDSLARAAAAGYYEGRSGDVVIYLRPYWLFGSGPTGTNHGSPYEYDQVVPLFLFGQGIRQGRFESPASPVDIAPTLASLLGITLPAPDGRVLTEALR